jgi:hypothetical protein
MFWVIETKTMNQRFRFNDPKQLSNSIILASFCSSHLAIKNYNVHFMKIEKSIKNSKNLCITTKTCTQIQNFKRNFLENYNDSGYAVKIKNAPFFMNFPNISKNGQLFPHWTGPLEPIKNHTS